MTHTNGGHGDHRDIGPATHTRISYQGSKAVQEAGDSPHPGCALHPRVGRVHYDGAAQPPPLPQGCF
jgi:hypothetical protein